MIISFMQLLRYAEIKSLTKAFSYNARKLLAGLSCNRVGFMIVPSRSLLCKLQMNLLIQNLESRGCFYETLFKNFTLNQE